MAGSIPNLEPLSPADQAALDQELRIGTSICDHYLQEQVSLSFATLEQVFDCWAADDSGTGPNANQLALGIGSLFGQLLASEYGCRWVISTDENGCDLAMIHDASGWQFFPRHSIAKRIDKTNAGQGMIQSLVATMEQEGYFKAG